MIIQEFAHQFVYEIFWGSGCLTLNKTILVLIPVKIRIQKC